MTHEAMILLMSILQRWFDLLDSDGSGEVSVNELEDPLLSVGLATSKQEVVDLIARVDKDGSGKQTSAFAG